LILEVMAGCLSELKKQNAIWDNGVMEFYEKKKKGRES